MNESLESTQPMRTRSDGAFRRIILSVIAQWKLVVAVMVLTAIAAALRFTLVEPQVAGEVIYKQGEKPVVPITKSKTDLEPKYKAVLPFQSMASILSKLFPDVQPELTIVSPAVIRMRILGEDEEAIKQSFKDIFAKFSELEQETLELEKHGWESKIETLSNKIAIIEFSFPALLRQKNFNSIGETGNLEDFILLIDQYYLWKSERNFLLSLLDDMDSMKSRIVREPEISSPARGRLVRLVALAVIGGFLLGVCTALIVGFTRYLITELNEAS